ncbi:hypothetical protein [Mycolicibacter virginiensis]|uniref:hypothetical protein n=1 Tax=Mycolicibacter virginiensis TaxID=1795032 RepID=UPI001F03CC4F|nr:hypothetical protein [Mycolicibacter virginiensis]ULP48011.1 hypothetical protein MJO54_02245 [Mycolicibacter virginiensis]
MTTTASTAKPDFTEYSTLRYKIESAATAAMRAAEESGALDDDLDSPLSWAAKAEQADRIWSGLCAGIQSLDRLDR